MIEPYWSEFLTVALLHLLAVASPGPDFAVILKQSLCRTRKEAIWTSLGISTGISVHVTYSLLGLGILISQSLLAFNILKFIAVTYLLYIGWQSLRAQPRSALDSGAIPDNSSIALNSHPASAFKLGFLTNVLNPKATLFFVALFAAVISPETPVLIRAFYGVWMVFATGLWFIGLSLLFSRPGIKTKFTRFGHWVERIMGIALIALAGKLASATLNH